MEINWNHACHAADDFLEMAHGRKKPILRIRNNLCNSEPGVVVKLANPVYKYAKPLGRRHPPYLQTHHHSISNVLWSNVRGIGSYDTKIKEEVLTVWYVWKKNCNSESTYIYIYIFFEKEIWIEFMVRKYMIF